MSLMKMLGAAEGWINVHCQVSLETKAMSTSDKLSVFVNTEKVTASVTYVSDGKIKGCLYYCLKHH